MEVPLSRVSWKAGAVVLSGGSGSLPLSHRRKN